MSYDTVVFDNDGVLVGRTSFDVLQEGVRETFSRLGVDDPDPEHVERLTVGATPDVVVSLCNLYDLEPDTFWETRDTTLAEAQQEEALAGRKTPYWDIDTLADLDVEMGIVSSNQQETVDFLVDHFSVFEPFGAAYGREATIESLNLRKPNPHYLDRALEDLNGENALFVGDNESDIRAAERAGVDSAFIRRPHRTDWELNVWPTWEIDTLEDLHDICRA